MNRILTVALLACVLTQSAALAQAPEVEPDIDRARSLFREGIEHVEANDFASAAVAFEAALALHDAPSIRFNLASALMETGRFVEAHRHLRALMSDDATDAAIRRGSEDLLARVVQRIGRLRVRASESLDQVTLDGQPVERDEETGVEPGRHTIVGSQDEQVVVERSVEVAAGERATVDLTVLRVDAESNLGSEPNEPNELNEPLQAEPPRRIVRNVAIIAAVVVVVATSIILAVALSGGEDEVQGDLQPGVLRW